MLNKKLGDPIEFAKKMKVQYAAAAPFPHIVIDEAIEESVLNPLAEDFPDLDQQKNVIRYSGRTDVKLASPRGDEHHSSIIQFFLRYLNSSDFIQFLQIITSIDEFLIPDPHFIGGGLHQIETGGFLKIHADFAKHRETNLDRRVNVIIYLNKDWSESYGGHLELYDKDMVECKQKIAPVYNRMVIFNTTDFSYHGHPDPLNCPLDRKRNSIATYYYSNGRPSHEIRDTFETESTIYKSRPGEKFRIEPVYLLRQFMPPIAYPLIRKLKKALKS